MDAKLRRRLATCSLGLALLAPPSAGCDDNKTAAPPGPTSTGQPTPPSSASRSNGSDESNSAGDSRRASRLLANLRKLTLDQGLDGALAAPEALDKVGYQTDWFEVHTPPNTTLKIRVAAKDEEGLRPMFTLLLPDGQRADWKAISTGRAAEGESIVDKKVHIDTPGVKLLSIDDVRNVERSKDQQPDAGSATDTEYLGGKGFGYRVSVERLD